MIPVITGSHPLNQNHTATDPAASELHGMLERYVQAAEKTDLPTHDKPALPVAGVYPAPVEDLFSHIEGWHLWRTRGRDDLAQQALERVRALQAELAEDMGVSLAKAVQQALDAPVRY